MRWLEETENCFLESATGLLVDFYIHGPGSVYCLQKYWYKLQVEIYLHDSGKGLFLKQQLKMCPQKILHSQLKLCLQRFHTYKVYRSYLVEVVLTKISGGPQQDVYIAYWILDNNIQTKDHYSWGLELHAV